MLEDKKILLVDDNEEICQMIRTYTQINKIDAIIEENSLEVLKILKTVEIDIIVLDIAMPGIDGFSLFREIKKEYNIPILFLSAKVHDLDRIEGLKLGAEDYIVKPFSLDELFLKINIILSRIDNRMVCIDDFEFDLIKQKVFYKEQYIKLTKKSYQLLFLLVNNKGKVVTRKEILKDVWGYEDFLDDRTIDTHIKEIRKQIEGKLIKTVRYKGYMYENV